MTYGTPNTIPRISIGLPVYNAASTIRKSLEALLRQTCGDFELIVSDNASTDATVVICEKFASRDSRVRVVRQAENHGQFWNFRYVLGPATGEYFMWAAADDWWHPTFIERCLAVLDARPDVGVVFSRARVTSRKLPLLVRNDLPHLAFVDGDDVFERVRKYIELPGSTQKANAIYGLWRTDLVRRTCEVVGAVEPRMAYLGLDIIMMTYVLTQTKMIHLPEILFDKTSKWFPSGSWMDAFLAHLLGLMRPAIRRQRGSFRRDLEEHVSLMRTVLERAGVLDERYERVLQDHLQRIVAAI